MSADNNEAIYALAQAMYEIQDKLDPGEDEETWDQLSEGEHEFYIQSVRQLLQHKELVVAATKELGE